MKARKRSVSDERLIADVQRIMQIEPKLTTEAIKNHGKFAWLTYHKHLGPIAEIRRKAGWTPPVFAEWKPGLLEQAKALFSWSEARCVEFLRRAQWPIEVCCTRCGFPEGVTQLKNQKIGNPEIRLYQCRDCLYQFSDLSGTIFCKTTVAVREWFLALLINASAGSVADKARALQVDLGLLRPRLYRLRDSAFAKGLTASLIQALENGK